MGLVTTITSGIAAGLRSRLIARAGGIDLTRLDRVPEQVAWPLRRTGVDPVPRLGEMRDRDPVFRLASFLGLDVWLVTGDAEAREVLADATSYSTDIRPYFGRSGSADGDIGGLGFTDPPEHTRLRKLLTPEFTMRRLARLQPTIDAVVERQLDELTAAFEIDGQVDIAQAFAFPIPFLVICELLGLPDDRREHFRTLASARFDISSGGMGTIGAISGSRDFLLREAARQRREPGPGLIGQIIREHGDEISDFDLGGLADGVFTGGLETSASMLALGTAVLLQERELWRRLAEEPGAAAPIVEELLRYLSVVQVAFPRFAKQDVVVGGHRIRKGAVVMVSIPAANRDGRVHPGDRLDPSRSSGSHLAFGHGMHRCIGAELARMELRTAFPGLARRFPELQLAMPLQELEFHDMSLVYGVRSVPVTLGGAVDPLTSRAG
ncbi:MAG TPA: cytochrome P450 [Marmoricola sp.]